ncbi:MAG: HAD family hydrolase [Firmicutes bacterium]|nr:HAD family hydrolase [Bacillota bacterium]
MKGIKSILFDLDGTLLPMDIEEFTESYFKELSKKLSEYFTYEELKKLVWTSTKYMVNNLEEDKLNIDAFFEDFDKKTNYDLEELKPIFDEFYNEDFKVLKNIAKPNEKIVKSVKFLKDKGYEIILATNPLFPKEAIYHRIQWSGLNKEDFVFITTYENMHFCKPNLEYYSEILNKIERKPSEVMMVGNDMQEDIIASELGIKTYLITNHLINKKNTNLVPHYKGTIDEFYDFTKQL